MAVGGTTITLVGLVSWLAWPTTDDANDGSDAPAGAHSNVDNEPALTSSPAAASAPAPAQTTAAATPAPAAAPTPAAPPERDAVDSGRAQPVFFNLMGSNEAHVGRPIKIDIAAESENDFASVLVTIQFDAARLQLAAVRPGNLMAQAGAAATLSYAVDAQAGRVAIEVREQAGGPPVSGGGSLASVEFLPRAAGPASVAIASAVVRDLNNEGVSSSTPAPHALTIRD
jgi:hypothetical protein